MADTLTRTDRDRADVLLDEVVRLRRQLAGALALAARWEQIARQAADDLDDPIVRITWRDVRTALTYALGYGALFVLAIRGVR